MNKCTYVLLFASLLVPIGAWADITYDFSYAGAGISASGTLTVTPVGAGGDEWIITGIAGQRNGSPIIESGTADGNLIVNGLNTSPLPDWTYMDDLLYFTAPALGSPSLVTFTATSPQFPNNGASGFAFSTAAGIFQPYTWAGGQYPGSNDPADLPVGQYEYIEGTYPYVDNDPNVPAFTNVPIAFLVAQIAQVAVAPVAAAVPEPSSIVLLATMLLGGGLICRRSFGRG